MTESTTISRRRFVAAGAGAAVIAGAGYLGFEGLSRADAADSTAPPAETYTRHSLCNACENQCGFTAYVVNGVLTKLVGDSGSPYGGGKLCGRGYGYATIAYNKDRLTEPLKRNENGSFSPISWDEAYFEIAEKLTALIAAHGAKTLALVHSPRPSGAFYGPRFFNALGSPNVYTHAAACNLSRDSGFAQVFGEGNYSADIANAKLVMLIGYNPAESVSPATLAAMQKSRANGGHIVLVDPRMTKSSTFADEWLPINPGTDLALVLAMAHVLVQRGIYHREFVAAHTVGFEDWAKRLAQYSPAWAEPITGIPAVTISRLAEQFAEAAPASVIDAGGYGAYGSAYLNSGETARAIALFNTLLGNWNQKGGALILPSPSFGKLDSNKFPEVPKPAGTKLGSSEYPLALNSLGSSVFAAEKAKEGALKAMFFYHSNVAADCPNPAYLAEALSQLELSVVIDVQMSETAQLAHYVLPDTSYLERLEAPELFAGIKPTAVLRDKVLEKIHAETRPVDQIFTELAQACGVGQYFDFTVEELADAQLKSIGLSLSALQASGSVQFEGEPFAYGTLPDLTTATGTFQFTSEACEKAGFTPSPEWIEPMVTPESGKLRLISGEQAVQTHTLTANIPDLMRVTENYRLTDPWLNAGVAEQLDIRDGDTIELSSESFTGRTRVHVTEAINPTAVYLPSHYGCTSKELKTAYGVGLRQMDFVPLQLEPGYGSAMSQEVLVTVKKVGA